MKQQLELENSEKVLLRRMESQARLWPKYRWVGLVAVFILMLGGAWNVFAAFRAALLAETSAPVVLIMAGLAGWTLVMLGFVLFTHIITRWDSTQRDQLLIKLLRMIERGREGGSEGVSPE